MDCRHQVTAQNYSRWLHTTAESVAGEVITCDTTTHSWHHRSVCTRLCLRSRLRLLGGSDTQRLGCYRRRISVRSFHELLVRSCRCMVVGDAHEATAHVLSRYTSNMSVDTDAVVGRRPCGSHRRLFEQQPQFYSGGNWVCRRSRWQWRQNGHKQL